MDTTTATHARRTRIVAVTGAALLVLALLAGLLLVTRDADPTVAASGDATDDSTISPRSAAEELSRRRAGTTSTTTAADTPGTTVPGTSGDASDPSGPASKLPVGPTDPGTPAGPSGPSAPAGPPELYAPATVELPKGALMGAIPIRNQGQSELHWSISGPPGTTFTPEFGVVPPGTVSDVQISVNGASIVSVSLDWDLMVAVASDGGNRDITIEGRFFLQPKVDTSTHHTGPAGALTLQIPVHNAGELPLTFSAAPGPLLKLSGVNEWTIEAGATQMVPVEVCGGFLNPGPGINSLSRNITFTNWNGIQSPVDVIIDFQVLPGQFVPGC